MSADSARDMERLVPINTDSLACLTMTRRDLVIDRMRYGEFIETPESDKTAIAYAEKNDYERLRMAPLFDNQLFPYSHFQEFTDTVKNKKKEAKRGRAPDFLRRPKIIIPDRERYDKDKNKEKHSWVPKPSWWMRTHDNQNTNRGKPHSVITHYDNRSNYDNQPRSDNYGGGNYGSTSGNKRSHPSNDRPPIPPKISRGGFRGGFRGNRGNRGGYRGNNRQDNYRENRQRTPSPPRRNNGGGKKRKSQYYGPPPSQGHWNNRSGGRGGGGRNGGWC